ncbi:MAG: transcription elongation factor GreA [Patescibacteria group bacterium]|nr:transcription elongation factor GreA [Patescibacteria group bacterium]MDE2116952.1 transcription elongation factor GreA [Patescibacteria group bacterium]
MPDSTKYLTKEKYKDLEQELAELKTVRRKEVAQSLEYARSLGDLSENAEYQEARELQATIEDRIAQIENTLKMAEIVNNTHGESIGMGSVVTLEKEGAKGPQKFTIVGSDEVSTLEGKISNLSPLGSALIGKTKGDLVTVKTPKGSTSYRVVSVA